MMKVTTQKAGRDPRGAIPLGRAMLLGLVGLVGMPAWVSWGAGNQIVVSTADPLRHLRLVVAKAPGGLAVDGQGNIYFSDYGDGSPYSGSVYLIRRSMPVPVKILTGLDQPGDIELTRDGRALIVGHPNGVLTRHYFGLTLQVQGAGGVPITDVTVYAETQLGPTKGHRADPEGYFRIPDILVPSQRTNIVSVVIERRMGESFSVEVPLGLYEESGRAAGETLKVFRISP